MEQYKPRGAVDPLNETKEEWLARRIAQLEEKIRRMEKHIQEDKAVRNRCKDMIESLMIRLLEVDARKSMNFITDASIYLNILEGVDENKTYPHYNDYERAVKQEQKEAKKKRGRPSKVKGSA